MKIYKSFIEQSTILSINQEIIQKTINIRKLNKPKLPDALIAGTAIVYDRTLIADNDKDFSRIPELKYMNPKNIR